MSNIVDRNVVVLTPEERDRGKFLTEAKHIERCRLALALGSNPVLDANSLPAMEVRPACNVSSRENSWHARFEIGIDDNTAINSKSSAFGEPSARARGDHEIRLKRAAAFKLHLLAVYGVCRVLEVGKSTVFLMERAHEVAYLLAENTLHRSFLRRHRIMPSSNHAPEQHGGVADVLTRIR